MSPSTVAKELSYLVGLLSVSVQLGGNGLDLEKMDVGGMEGGRERRRRGWEGESDNGKE